MLLMSTHNQKQMSIQKLFILSTIFVALSFQYFLIEMNCEITMCCFKSQSHQMVSCEWIFLEDFCRKSISLNHLENLLVRSNLSVYQFVVLFLSNFILTHGLIPTLFPLTWHSFCEDLPCHNSTFLIVYICCFIHPTLKNLTK